MTTHAAKAQTDLLDASLAGVADIVRRVAIIALLARRAAWMIALCRVAPQTPTASAFSPAEIAMLGRMGRGEEAITTLASALARLASIAGAPGRRPTPLSVARGLSRLADLQIAARLRATKYSERP